MKFGDGKEVHPNLWIGRMIRGSKLSPWIHLHHRCALSLHNNMVSGRSNQVLSESLLIVKSNSDVLRQLRPSWLHSQHEPDPSSVNCIAESANMTLKMKGVSRLTKSLTTSGGGISLAASAAVGEVRLPADNYKNLILHRHFFTLKNDTRSYNSLDDFPSSLAPSLEMALGPVLAPTHEFPISDTSTPRSRLLSSTEISYDNLARYWCPIPVAATL
jgi:hypothetical protein